MSVPPFCSSAVVVKKPLIIMPYTSVGKWAQFIAVVRAQRREKEGPPQCNTPTSLWTASARCRCPKAIMAELPSPTERNLSNRLFDVAFWGAAFH